MASVCVGIVAFNGVEFLQKCLESVFAQTYPSIEVHVLDNASTDGTSEFVSRNFPQVTLVSSNVNLGFARGHNEIIRATLAPYVLALNQDACLSPGFLAEMVAAMECNPEVGIAGGKLYSLRPHSKPEHNGNIIDVTWLEIEKKRRQVCYAQELCDNGQFDSSRLVFAIDGAAMFLRRAMLQEIGIEGEYFDEDFFAGKEDLDLSWRAQLRGWKCMYVPSAIGWHLRTFTPSDSRENISESLKINSIRNRYLLMLKNDFWGNFFRHLPHIALYDAKILGYVILRERSSLKGYAQALALLPRAIKKRKLIMKQKKVDAAYILQWFV